MSPVISSTDNPQFKSVRKLAQSGRERRKTGLTLLDGLHLIKAWQASGRNLQKILLNAALLDNSELSAWLSAYSTVPASVFSPGLYAAMVGDDFPSGVMALVDTPSGQESPQRDCDTVVLDGVQDPGNVGTLLRSAAAAGFAQAVLSPNCAQVWGPKTLRAGMGAHFVMTLHEAIDLPNFLPQFAGRVAATCLAGDSLYDADLAGPLAWVFGSEGEGVSADVLHCARLKVNIPMPGKVESLNVSAAAAVCLFETLRQRQTSRR